MDKKCQAQITVRLPKELREIYEQEARRQRRKPSDLIRLALENQASNFSKQESVAA